MLTKFFEFALIIVIMFFQISLSYSQTETEPLVLQEMSWVDVKEYLKSNDMVIIPLGSTEQHGPHLPLGTDYLNALERSKMISKQTGVVVAPILLVGCSKTTSRRFWTSPFKGEYEQAVVYSILNEKAEAITGLRTGLPMEFIGVNLMRLSKK